jgi:hypothetical protein
LRQVGNDGVVRVTVPLTDVSKKSSKAAAAVTGQSTDDLRPGQAVNVPMTSPLISGPGQVAGVPRIIETLKGAIDSLRSQLERERDRVDRAERLLEEERSRADDAITAQRIAAGESAALRAELDRRRDWGLLSRMRWVLRGDR